MILRQAATHFPDHPLAKQAAADMAEEFHRPLSRRRGRQAVAAGTRRSALYDEFRELTPPGAEGDRMIAALADRLMTIDLFVRAGDLLERQVKTRLSGADKVAAGTRLAAIRLLDDKPGSGPERPERKRGSRGLGLDLVAERKRSMPGPRLVRYRGDAEWPRFGARRHQLRRSVAEIRHVVEVAGMAERCRGAGPAHRGRAGQARRQQRVREPPAAPTSPRTR